MQFITGALILMALSAAVFCIIICISVICDT